MDESRSNKPEGAPPPPPPAGAGPERRFAAQRKLAAVTRLLQGEPRKTVAQALNSTVARPSAWRHRALVAAETAMQARERDGRDQKLLRLKPKLGELTMANKRLEQKIAALWAAGARGAEPGRLPSHRPR